MKKLEAQKQSGNAKSPTLHSQKGKDEMQTKVLLWGCAPQTAQMEITSSSMDTT